MELILQKKGTMFLHKELGNGKMPDGRKVRLIQTNRGIHMQVYPIDKKETNKGNWDTYSLSYDELSQNMFQEIKKIEAHSSEGGCKK